MASNKTHLQQTTVIGVRLLLVVLLLSVSTAHVNAQPYTTIVSYPRPGTAVPVPGVLNVADAPPVPVTVVPASSTSPSSTTAAATTEQTTTTASCTTNWCTRDGQWLPINVNYILIAVALGLLMIVFRSDRRMLAMLFCWACTLYLMLIVNQFAIWYIALAVDFAVYSLMYSGDDSKKEEEDDDEEEEENEGEGEGEEDLDGEYEDGETDGAGLQYEQPLDPAAKSSQPATSRDSGRRASVMLTKLQL